MPVAKIDLHIHCRECSDGKMGLSEIFEEAHRRGITLISITDHDSIACQEAAISLAGRYGMNYLTGVELNISFSHPEYREGKPVSLDLLGYAYDIHNSALSRKLEELREYRRLRAEKILQKLNEEFEKKGLPFWTQKDLEAIQSAAEGALGRPHIANYMMEKGIVSSKQEAFDKYLVRCNVPKMPLSLREASELIRGAGGKLVLAHPNCPSGTSLVTLTPSIKEQQAIIKEKMLPYLDGIECWHSTHDQQTVDSYLSFALQEGLMVTGGSDCHQQPIIIGTVAVPAYVAGQFHIEA